MRRILNIAIAAFGILTAAAPAMGHDTFLCWAPKATSPALTASATEYWTEERQRKAVPLDDGLQPKIKKGKRAQLDQVQKVDVTKDPYKRGGKLFFTMAGTNYVASAQFVDDRILLTAAHAIWKGSAPSTNVYFVRAYNNGGGTGFTVDLVSILKAWVPISADPPSASWAAKDYAVLRVTADSDGGKFTISPSTDFAKATMMGYPASIDAGEYMYAQVATRVGMNSGALVAAPFELSPGVSGGAWFLDDATAGYPLVSIVSTFWGTEFVAGPVASGAADMIGYVKGGCL